MPITLKAARVNAGFSQKRAAELLKISESTLRKYEFGKTFPDVPVIQNIEMLYNISYNDIIFCSKSTVKP